MADHDPLFALASELVDAFMAAGKTVATAESCTGGWIAKAITDVAGSSAVFRYGIVCYADEAKQSLLGVLPETLARDGAKPVGTVWLAWTTRDGEDLETEVSLEVFAGDRKHVRVQTVATALTGLVERV